MADSYAEMAERLISRLKHDAYQLSISGRYYDSLHRPEAVGIAVPREMEKLTAHIGWPRLYLDSIEERLDLENFRLGNSGGDRQASVDELMDWWKANGLDEESSMAHLDALVYGRSYVTVTAPAEDADDVDPNVPIIRVESPFDMYAETDPRTRQVTRAVRVYTNEDGNIQWATLFLPDEVIYLREQGGRWVVDPEVPSIRHNLGQVPVVPIVNRERLSDRHGRSEITPELRSITDAAARIMMDMQAAAEIMAVPQRVIFGVDAAALAPNGSPVEVMNAYMAQILAIEDPQGKAQQFQAAELMNYVNALQELAKHFAAYTGLPPQYLSFSSENPASAEAIKSSESRLVKKCERKARMFGGSWEQVMRLAMRVMGREVPAEFSRLEAVWRDPSTPTYAAKADGVTKLYANGMGIITKRRAREDMGYSEEEIREMEDQERAEQGELRSLADILGAAQANRPAGPGQQSSAPAEGEAA